MITIYKNKSEMIPTNFLSFDAMAADNEGKAISLSISGIFRPTETGALLPGAL